MPTGDLWVRLSVHYADDPKMRQLVVRNRAEGRAARDLYVQMVCYAKRTSSDGFVPDEELGLLVYPDPIEVGERQAELLAAVGLIERVDGGWVIASFLKWNQASDQLASKTEGAQLGNHRRWHVARGVVEPGCPHCGGVRWSVYEDQLVES